MHISKKEQRKRFRKITKDPSLAWKIGKDERREQKLYGEYEAAMMKVGDRRVRVILEYAEYQDNVSNSRARRLLDEVLAIDRAELDQRAAYVKKFRKVLPDKKVTRFFQIERKMDAQLDMELARQIPLVD